MALHAQLEFKTAWNEIRLELRSKVGQSTFDIWLAPLEALRWDGTVLLLASPASTHRWVAMRFGRALDEAARSRLGDSARVELVAADTDPRPARRRGRTDKHGHHTPTADPLSAATSPLIPRYTFDQFIIGEGNRLAHAAALAVAEAPGQAYNPLFLHAPPGLGKTHLLHAIGNYINTFEPSLTVRYTTVEAFTNNFIAALGSRDLEGFKHLYRDADVLLIDDLQFLASKAKTEEELFHTFNAVYDSGRQLALTCDRLPSQLVGVEKRFCERFEAGLVARLAPPDRATRVAILRKRAAVDRIHIPNESVIELIADRITDNVRSLEGALIRIVAYHSLTGRPLDLDLAEHVLDEIHPQAGSDRQLTIEIIQQAVASHFELTVQQLVSATRIARVAWARQMAIALAHELTDEPLSVIGNAFGGRNHATVVHACKRVQARISLSSQDQSDLQQLRDKLNADHVDRRC